MSSKSIVVKNPFLDKERDNEKMKPGDLMRVSPDRAKRLIELGYAVASTDDEADEIKELEPKTIAVTKDTAQWVEVKEVKPVVKKAGKKK